MENVLITGGLGFIFSYVSEYLANKGIDVFIVDNLSDGSNPKLLETWTNLPIWFKELDINDINSWDSEIEFEYIIHAAAESNVDKSIENQKAFIQSNINGTYQMLEFARRQPKLKKFMFVNTDEVYGSSEKHCCAYTTPTHPTNPYSASKLAGSAFTWAYHNTYKIPVQEIRMCNIVGKRQADTKLLPRVIDLMKQDKPIPIYDGGGATREYMDVREVPPILEFLLDQDEKVINITFNQELRILDVVRIVATQLGKDTFRQIDKVRPGHDWHYRMVPSPVMQNFKRRYNFDDTVTWMLDTPDQAS